MDARDLARYIESTNGITKPWLLMQLRVKKLQERRSSLSDVEYQRELESLHREWAKLGEWWRGIENEVF